MGDGVNHGIRHFVGHRKRQRVVGNFPRLRVPVVDQNPCSSTSPHVLRVQLFIQPGHIPTNCDVAFTQNRNEGPGGSTLEKFPAPSFEFKVFQRSDSSVPIKMLSALAIDPK